MRINILLSESVSYEDIGSERRVRVSRRRVSKPRRRRIQPKDRLSVTRRKVTNLRAKIKSRLDTINGVMGKKRPTDAGATAKLRQDVRSLYQDYKRTKMILERMEKSEKK